jgi:hypothetical protein
MTSPNRVTPGGRPYQTLRSNPDQAVPKVPDQCSEIIGMKYSQLSRKVCALLAATLILPALAYAGTDNGNGNGGQNNGNQNRHNKGDVPTLPDGGPGFALLATTFGAVLLYSWRQFSRARATQK